MADLPDDLKRLFDSLPAPRFSEPSTEKEEDLYALAGTPVWCPGCQNLALTGTECPRGYTHRLEVDRG